MSDYTYPIELIKKAESRIQTQVKGNGADPKDFTLNVKRQGIGIFRAQTSFQIETDIQQKREKGRKNTGRVVPQGQMDTEVRGFISNLTTQDSTISTAKDIIQKMPLNGFGADKEIIPLTAQKTIFCEHVNCQQCQGQGKSKCARCHGKAQMPCNLCNGRGLLKCMQCHGVGTIQSGDKRIPCTMCQGRREKYCTQCKGQRVVSCTACQAKGMTSCTICGGEGVQSVITTITPLLKTTSIVHIPDLDEDSKRMVARVGADILARGGHITIKAIKPVSDDENDDDQAHIDNNAVYYQGRIEWAVADFNYGGKRHDITFAGKKGAVCESSNFMDMIIDKPLTQIKKAANGEGFVAGLLKDACDYRVSRETLSFIANGNRKKAHAQLCKIYKLGTSSDTLKNITQYGYQALKNVTKRPRYIGLTIGLILSCGLSYLWFMHGLRDHTAQYDEMVRYAIDVVPCMIAIAMTILLIKGVGYITLKSTMRDIGITKYKAPALGKAGLYAVIGNMVIWGGFVANLLL